MIGDKALQFPTTVVPPLTPFAQDLSVDVAALERGVNYVVEDCDAGIVIVAGVEAQEYQFLSFEARKELIRQTIAFVDGRRPVTVGVSHPSFRVAVELAQFAQSLGSQSVQLLAPTRPFGGAPSTADLVGYFEAVGREIDVPIMLYLNAGPGADVSIPATIELASLDCIGFVKESSRDLARVSRLIEEIEHVGYARYFTTMQMWLASLMLGGTGVTLPPPAAKLAHAIAKAFSAGDWIKAARIQRQLALWPSRWMHYGLAPVMKASLEWLGVPCGQPYPPYRAVEGADLDALHDYLATTDLARATAGNKEAV
jgi:4-hydroxy-tetrahydrodipicolinate synthase